ncbi:MAG TPA: hypothetical protein VF064_14235 [Pyrinomonadaceae bacterium]
MRATRRRTRTPDPLTRPEAVRDICEEVRSRMHGVISNSERHLIRFLYAVRHVERRPATDTRRGRPSRWRREDLISAAGHLRAVLQRETSGRLSLNSFVGQYLQILDFPSDVQGALADGRINLQEAAQLARLTGESLGCSAAEARRTRAEILQAHLTVQGSQTRLRSRVKEMLGEASAAQVSSEGVAEVVLKVDELLEVDPADTRHLFFEEMKRLFFAMREIEADDLNEEILNDFLHAVDQVSNVLSRIEKKRRERLSAQS